ncbi:hypothetical protein D3C79_470700 [compost metagenome]
MPRYKLIQDFGGMKAGDEIVTEQLSDMLKPVAVEIEEAKLEVATPESSVDKPKRQYNKRTEDE